MADADPITFGSRQMTVSSASTVFPTDGVGGSQASVDSRFPAKGTYLFEGLTVQTAGTGTFTGSDGAGNALFTITLTASLTAGAYVQIGGVNGYESSGAGISAKMSAGSVTLWFRRIG